MQDICNYIAYGTCIIFVSKSILVVHCCVYTCIYIYIYIYISRWSHTSKLLPELWTSYSAPSAYKSLWCFIQCTAVFNTSYVCITVFNLYETRAKSGLQDMLQHPVGQLVTFTKHWWVATSKHLPITVPLVASRWCHLLLAKSKTTMCLNLLFITWCCPCTFSWCVILVHAPSNGIKQLLHSAHQYSLQKCTGGKSQLRSKRSSYGPSPRNFLTTSACFECNTSGVKAVGWLDKKKERRSKNINNSEFRPFLVCHFK